MLDGGVTAKVSSAAAAAVVSPATSNTIDTTITPTIDQMMATAALVGESKELGEPVVVIKHLSKSYQVAGTSTGNKSAQLMTTTTALRDIHLAVDSEFQPIRRGEFVILRGPSGGGKTSLLNILGAIDTASGGQVEILNDVIDETSSDAFLSDLRLRKIGKS
jgi:putative ABC transport system ATP-binding protein